MIVVFLTHNYPRFAGDLPGSFLHRLSTALLARGHEVRVVAPSDRGRGGRDELDGIPVRRVRYGAPEAETLAYTGRMQEAIRSPAGWLAIRGMVRALRAGVRAELDPVVRPGGGRPVRRPAVIHAHWWFPAGLAAPRELPAVVTLHGTDGRLLRRNPLVRALGRRVLRRARLVTAVSPELASLAEGASGRSDVASHVCPMPVDSSRFRWSRGGGGVLVVARLSAQKRVDLAIQAVRVLARAGRPVPLTIVGEGPERAGLERLAGPDLPVRFAGALSRSEVEGLLETADVMLFPAEHEGLGLAPLEALMCGVPVVACTDGGGVVSALERYGGGGAVEPNPEALARAVEEAWHAGARAAARQAGVAWRERLAPARVAEVFEIWYAEALAG